jgi:hypothetical protein
MIQNSHSMFSKGLRRVAITIAIVASGTVAAPAVYAKASSIVLVPPTALPDSARQTGEAMFLHDTADGKTLLYIEHSQGSELAILDVTDPSHVRAGGSVNLEATGPFDFVSTLGESAELVRFRQSQTDAVLDLHAAQAPTLRTVQGLSLQGPAMPLGEDGFMLTNQVGAEAQPTRDYQIVDTANSQELYRVFDVKQVREEVTRKETGTTFLLTDRGLYLIRRPAVEMYKNQRDLAYAG